MPVKMDKEQWIDEVLNSTQGMQQAMPGTGFYEQVLDKLNRPVAVKGVTMPLKKWAAAAILLLALNVGSIVHFIDSSKRQPMAESGGNPLAGQMQLETTYNY